MVFPKILADHHALQEAGAILDGANEQSAARRDGRPASRSVLAATLNDTGQSLARAIAAVGALSIFRGYPVLCPEDTRSTRIR